MFDDMTDPANCERTENQVALKHSVAILSACLDLLEHCVCFIFTLRHYDDGTIATWLRIFNVQVESLRYWPETVVSEWMWLILLALRHSKKQLPSVHFDEHPSTIVLPQMWLDDATSFGLYSSLDVEELELRFNPDICKVNTEDTAWFFCFFKTMPMVLKIGIEPAQTAEGRDATSNMVSALCAQSGYSDITIDTGYTYDVVNLDHLKALAANNKSSLTSLQLPGLVVDVARLGEFLNVLKSMD